MKSQPSPLLCLGTVALCLASLAGAQSTVVITDYQDSDAARTLTVVPGKTSRQTIAATFLIQGDNLPLGDLTVSQKTTLQGSNDTTWLQNSDAGFQAKLLLNTTFSAEINGTPGQSDASGALQSLINTAAAQGYTTIPTGSYIKFIHALDITSFPVMQKNAVQIVDSYTLQHAGLGLGSSSNALGTLQNRATPPAKATPAKIVAPAKAKVSSPVKNAVPVKGSVKGTLPAQAVPLAPVLPGKLAP